LCALFAGFVYVEYYLGIKYFNFFSISNIFNMFSIVSIHDLYLLGKILILDTVFYIPDLFVVSCLEYPTFLTYISTRAFLTLQLIYTTWVKSVCRILFSLRWRLMLFLVLYAILMFVFENNFVIALVSGSKYVNVFETQGSR
jgi:hypothetical protein